MPELVDSNSNLDVLGKYILQDVQKIYPQAIIAGGYCRDILGKKEFKDVDIFVPNIDPECSAFINNHSDNWELIETKCEFSTSDEYRQIREVISSINNFRYADGIDIQIMMTQFDVEDFASTLLDDFSFGIDQCFSSGNEILISEICQHDIRYNKATLLNCNSLSELPSHMNKFFRLKEKYPQLKFDSTILKIK